MPDPPKFASGFWMPDPARPLNEMIDLEAYDVVTKGAYDELLARLAAADEDFRVAESELEHLRGELTETEARLAAAENVVEAARAVSETSGSPHDALDAMYEALNAYDAHKGKP